MKRVTKMTHGSVTGTSYKSPFPEDLSQTPDLHNLIPRGERATESAPPCQPTPGWPTAFFADVHFPHA